MPCETFSSMQLYCTHYGCTFSVDCGSAELACDGFPTFGLPKEACAAQPGCTVQRADGAGWTCTGTLTLPSCKNYAPQFCPAGCAPVPDQPCDGTPIPCAEIFVEATCRMILGCTWTGDELNPCVGTTRPCSDFSGDAVKCWSQNCTYPGTCEGNILDCSAITYENGFAPADCRRQEGCSVVARN